MHHVPAEVKPEERERVRRKLTRDVERFLQSGGQIKRLSAEANSATASGLTAGHAPNDYMRKHR
jgi:hypothetical protein